MREDKKINQKIRKKKADTPGLLIGTICFVFCLTVVTIFLVLMFTEHKNNDSLSEKALYDSLDYSEGWDKYLVNADGTDEKILGTNISLPDTYLHNDLIEYRKVLKGEIRENDRIYLHTNYQVVEIFVDGEKVNLFGMHEISSMPDFTENPWTAFLISKEMEGKELVIRLEGKGDKIAKDFYQVLRGPYSNIRWVLMLDAMTSEIPCIIIGLIMLLILIFTAIISGKFRVNGVSDSIYLSLFVLLSILWIYTDSSMQGAFFIGSRYFHYINLFSFLLFEVPFMFYLRRRFSVGKKFCSTMALSLVVTAVLALIMMPYGLYRCWATLAVSHVIIGISLFGMFAIAIYEWRHFKKKESINLICGLAIIGIAGIITILNFYFGINGDNTSAFRCGVLVFVALLCISGIYKSVRVITTGRMFEGLSETIPAGICRMKIDDDITIIYANDFYYRLFGYTEHDTKIQEENNQRYFVSPEDFEQYKKKILDKLAEKIPSYEIEVRYQANDKHIFWGLERHEVNLETKEITATVYDITARKEMEEQLRISEEQTRTVSAHKTEFLANMSHEIRTPMNVICGMTEMLDSREHDPLEQEYISMIRSASSNLLNIINDILDFTKIDSGKMELIPAEYSFSEMLNDVQNIIAPKISLKMLRFLVYADPRIPEKLYGDDGRVRQILINLLNNAAKFTDRGEISLMVKMVQSTGKKVRLSFSIRDTGIGIKEDDINKLFTQFSRVDTRRNRSIEGTGLGLALCKELTEKMNGEIRLESVYGEGSIFTAVIEQDIASEQHLYLDAHADQYHVLIMEEDKAREQSVKQAVRDIGIQNVFTLVGDLVRNPGKYPVVIYDYSTFSMVLKQIPELKDVFCIAMLEYGNRISEELGEQPFVQKPVSITNLSQFFTENGPRKRAMVQKNRSQFTVKNAKVAVVDDNELNLKVADGLLKSFGVQAQLIGSGRKLIQEMEQGTHYDLVFLDHMMPEMDGVETVVHIRKKGNEEWVQMPIIALTANAIKGVEKEFLKAGMTDCLFKPIDKMRLGELLATYLRPFCVYTEQKQIPASERVIVSTIKGAEEAEPLQNNNDNIGDDIPHIPGIQVLEGIELVGGDVPQYMDILKEYISRIEGNAIRLQKFLGIHDIKEYTTLVHSMKSSARIIGNTDLAEKALALENAGHEGDWNTIIAGTEQFLNQYVNQLELFKKYVPQLFSEEQFAESRGTLPEDKMIIVLQGITERLEDFDDEGAIRLLDEAMEYELTPQIRGYLLKIRDKVHAVDYQAALDLVSGKTKE